MTGSKHLQNDRLFGLLPEYCGLYLTKVVQGRTVDAHCPLSNPTEELAQITENIVYNRKVLEHTIHYSMLHRGLCNTHTLYISVYLRMEHEEDLLWKKLDIYTVKQMS